MCAGALAVQFHYSKVAPVFLQQVVDAEAIVLPAWLCECCGAKGRVTTILADTRVTHIMNNWALSTLIDVWYVRSAARARRLANRCGSSCSAAVPQFIIRCRRYAVQVTLFYGVVFSALGLYAAYAAVIAGLIGALERVWWVLSMIRAIPDVSTFDYKLPVGAWSATVLSWAGQVAGIVIVFVGNANQGLKWASYIVPVLKAASILYAAQTLFVQRPMGGNDRKELNVPWSTWPDRAGPASKCWTEGAADSVVATENPAAGQNSA